MPTKRATTFEKDRRHARFQRDLCEVLVQALNVEENDVVPEATLQGDLGAESIDMLDIVFRLEREFGIRIPRGELFPESVFQGDPDFVQEGRVTDAGMAELKSRMPYADLGNIDRDRRLAGISDLFTVDLIARYIAWKLSKGAEKSVQEPSDGADGAIQSFPPAEPAPASAT